MKILAAIDLMGGLVVRGVAGERNMYAPLRSSLTSTDTAEPAAILRGLHERLGIEDFYLADLDAIAGAEPNWEVYQRLLEETGRLRIDAGIADAQRAQRMARFAKQNAGVTGIIVALESIRGKHRLREVCREIPPELLVFSLDLKSGGPLGATGAWHDSDPMAIVADAVELGVERLIVLDLAAVGVGNGCPTLSLCQSIRRRFEHLEITTGGGVRGVDDLSLLASAGCDAALVASAFHNGRIERDDLIRFVKTRSAGETSSPVV